MAPNTNNEEKLSLFEQKDAAHAENIIKRVREVAACYGCGNQDATQSCSACKVVVYCGASCQRKDWVGGHREQCKLFRQDCKDKESLAFCLSRCGLIDEDTCQHLVKERQKLLFATLFKDGSPKRVSLQASVCSLLGEIRLVVAFSYYDRHTQQVKVVKDVLLEKVAEESAKGRLYDGCGTLAPETRKEVISLLLNLVTRTYKAGLTITGFTFGRGMMDVADDPVFERQLGEIGCHAMADTCAHLAMTDSFNAAMGAALNM